MSKRGRPPSDAKPVRLVAEAEILAENPDISDIEMVEELKKRGISTTRQTVHTDRQEQMDNITLDDIQKSKNSMLKEIDNLIAIAYARATSGESDSLRAMDKYDKLFNTKAKVLSAFEAAKMAAKVEERPVINITIGKPKEIKKDEKDTK